MLIFKSQVSILAVLLDHAKHGKDTKLNLDFPVAPSRTFASEAKDHVTRLLGVHKMQELSEPLRSVVLPPTFVSFPSAEDGFVSLHQQTGLSAEDETPAQTTENWRSKAIRRKLSKLKELVLFVGGLPSNLDKADYVKHLSLFANKREDACVGPIFPEQGCLFISFTSGMAAASIVKSLHDRKLFGKRPTLIFLPFISVPTGSPMYDPLLVFINSKSGGGQGKQLLEMMRGSLNKNQVFLLELGGPMPGLYAFRKLPRFRILVCGGDGTAGWVLSGLEQIHRHITCKNPPIAILPLGTGNDLARVLGFGSGWSGENIGTVLTQVQEAKPVEMDRWTIFFDSSPSSDQKTPSKQPHQSYDQPNGEPKTIQTEPDDDAMVNGHRRLQRTCKYNHQRSRVNIVMGIGDNTVWQTADMFNLAEAEEDDGNKDSSHISLSTKLSNGSSNGEITHESNEIEANPETLEKTEKNVDKLQQELNSEANSDEDNVLPLGTEFETSQGNSEEVDAGLSEENKTEFFDETVLQSDEVPLKKDDDGITEFQRKSVHRKLHILSSSDILDGTDTSFGPFRQLTQVSKCESLESEDELETVERSIESVVSIPEDVVLKQGDVDEVVNEILQSELPDIINDKQKLITLLASDDAHSELDKIIKESKMQGENSDVKDSKFVDISETDVRKQSMKIITSGNFVDTFSAGRTGGMPRQRALTAFEDNGLPFDTRKIMSLPLITSDETFKAPSNGLGEMAWAEEDNKGPEEPSAGPRVVTMNNYFGIGIDAEVSLAFHLAREENPGRFSSRLHNKAVYLKAGLKKMTSRTHQLNQIVDLEVDGAKISLPSVKGLIFLNIASWGGGGNAWGSSVSRRFQTPSFGDGLLEVVGVGGVAHMSQIYSGIRTGLRIAQGEYVKLHLRSEVAVQVDGEPWMQPPGQIIITVSALQVMMLKRQKKKIK